MLVGIADENVEKPVARFKTRAQQESILEPLFACFARGRLQTITL